MQAKALDEWHVPQIFAALPLLLQMGLALFLSGIVEFLWHIDHQVSYPILVAVCLLFLFLLLSTWLPAWQELFPGISKGEMVPSPCPYNSPQSRLSLLLGLYAKRRMIKWGFVEPSPSAFHSVCKGHTDGERCQRHQECWLYYRDLDTNREPETPRIRLKIHPRPQRKALQNPQSLRLHDCPSSRAHNCAKIRRRTCMTASTA
jgi:hypothetical protein